MAARPKRARPAARPNHPYMPYTQPMRPVTMPAQRGHTAVRGVRTVAYAPAPVRDAAAPARPVPVYPAARPQRQAPGVRAPQRRPATRKRTVSRKGGLNPWLLALAVPAVMLALTCMVVTLGGVFLFTSSTALPGVSAAGVPVGGMSAAEAAQALNSAWANGGLMLRDGKRQMPVDPALLGITLDAEGTARLATSYGRSAGGLSGLMSALVGRVDVPPVVRLEPDALRQGLNDLRPQLEQAAVNAGVQLVNGQVEPRAAAAGRALDVEATAVLVEANPSRALADGTLDLVMYEVQPTVTDAGPMVEAARALLANPLNIRAYNPATDETTNLTAFPQEWSQWLVAQPDSSAPFGLRLSLDEGMLTGFLRAREDEVGSGQYLNIDESVERVQAAIGAGDTSPYIRVYNEDRQHVVQPGETIISIAWDYGVPYPWILDANPGVDGVSAGQTITIPSPDTFMEYPVVFGKRIVVSISQQRAWVYEDDRLKWEWTVSTGIQSSPTWPGIYQIILHEQNAYAANWDLWMPYFLGVYRPIPGADFTNGFHGFPTRGGSQLLWTNSLGTRVTYGCILLNNENAQALYDWAEEGVVVEIQA